MFEAAYDLGKSLLDCENQSPEDSIYVDAKADYLFVVDLGDPVMLEVMEYDPSRHIRQFPFRPSKGNGAALVPSAILNITHPKKTLDKKLIGWFKKSIKSGNGSTNLLKEGQKILSENVSSISNEIESKISGEMQRSTILLAIKFQDEKKQAEFSALVESSILAAVSSKYSQKYNSNSRGINECYYCGEEKEVNGFAAPFTFYTHDKVTYAPDFDRSQAWKNFPVCSRCELTTEKGIAYIEKNLVFSFFGVKYLLFPQLIHRKESIDLIQMVKEAHENREKGRQKVTLSADEDELLDEFAEEQNLMTLTFLFYKKNNSQFEVLNIIDDVLPSRLSELFEAKKNIESRSYLKEWWNSLPWRDSNPDEFLFSYSFLREIYPKALPGEEGNSDAYRSQFLEMTAYSFKRIDIPRSSVLVPTVRKLQHLIANQSEATVYHFAMKSLALYEYFTQIGCIQRSQKLMDTDNITDNLGISKSQLSQKVRKLFEENMYFDHDTKKASFITGILCRTVGERQQMNLNSKPFYERFDGLRLTNRKIKRVFTDAIAKLHEYDADKMEISALETLASHYFMSEGVALNNEDLCFSFALGLSFGRAVWEGYKKGENNE